MSELPTSRPAPPGGCLTDAQIAEVQAAAPGRAPEPLARHLASCERCQARALFGAGRRPGRPGRATPPVLPSPRRALVLLGLAIAAFAAFFYTLVKLAGRID